MPTSVTQIRMHVALSSTLAVLHQNTYSASFYKAQYHQSLTHCARTCLIVSFIRFIRTVTLQKNYKNNLCFSHFCNCHFLTFNSNVVEGIFSEWRATSDFPEKWVACFHWEGADVKTRQWIGNYDFFPKAKCGRGEMEKSRMKTGRRVFDVTTKVPHFRMSFLAQKKSQRKRQASWQKMINVLHRGSWAFVAYNWKREIPFLLGPSLLSMKPRTLRAPKT